MGVKEMSKLKGLATGIGSMPQKETEGALDLIFQYLPNIPFWPQLPKRDLREGMLVQFSENISCLRLTRDGLRFDPAEKEKELEIFYERIIANDVDYFKISEGFALGLHRFYQRLEKMSLKDISFIKCQVTGPFTFAAGIKDDKAIALLHDPVFMQVIIKGLAMKALWQIKFFRKFGKKIIVFLDEPYLGCFGSAYTPINRQDVVKGLTELTEGLKSEDVLSGVHCCGNTDWSIFTDIANIDIISFDAFGFSDKFVLYADSLKGFLKKGGIICWGIVPTQDFSLRQTPDSLVGSITQGIDALVKRGLDKDLLFNNLLVSPSCGLGTLEIKKSEEILKLLSEASFLLRKNL
jgi:methionine synthase II (cobalamin-independent)